MRPVRVVVPRFIRRPSGSGSGPVSPPFPIPYMQTCRYEVGISLHNADPGTDPVPSRSSSSSRSWISWSPSHFCTQLFPIHFLFQYYPVRLGTFSYLRAAITVPSSFSQPTWPYTTPPSPSSESPCCTGRHSKVRQGRRRCKLYSVLLLTFARAHAHVHAHPHQYFGVWCNSSARREEPNSVLQELSCDRRLLALCSSSPPCFFFPPSDFRHRIRPKPRRSE